MALGAIALAACDAASPPCGAACTPDPDIVAGVDLAALFAPPTPAERALTAAARAERDAERAGRYAFADVATHRAPGPREPEEWRVVAALDAARPRDTLFYAAIRLPPRPLGDVRTRPFLLVLPSADAVAADVPAALPIAEYAHGEIVFGVVAFRGQVLRVGGRAYRSPAPPAPYDADVDDALAVLGYAARAGAALLVDPARKGLYGFGRGGGVALLTLGRARTPDEHVRLVVSLAAPTTFFTPGLRDDARRYLQGRPLETVPGFAPVLAPVLDALRAGSLALAEARAALLLRSAAYVAAPPPYTLAIHGADDGTVPVEHGRALVMLTGRTTAAYLELPDAGHETLATGPAARSPVTEALRSHLGVP